MAIAQSQMAADWIEELLHGRNSLPYRELVGWDKSTVLRDALIDRAKEIVDKEISRILGSPQFDQSVNDESVAKGLEYALLEAFTFTMNDLQDAAGKSISETSTSWSDTPLDLRSLEADAESLAQQIFERAEGLGFTGEKLEPNVLVTVLNMSEVKVLADVVKLEESLHVTEMSVEDLALVLARFQALRNDYVVTRKMVVGGSITELSAEVVEPEKQAELIFTPAPRPVVVDDNPFGLPPSPTTGTKPPAPAKPPMALLPVSTKPPMMPPTPTKPPMTPPHHEPTIKLAEAPEHQLSIPTMAPPTPAPTTAAPVLTTPSTLPSVKSGETFDLFETWKETFMNPANRKSIMESLRTKNDAEYESWVNKVSLQTSWKTARIHIDNYLYIFGVDRTAPIWLKMMKTSSLFFPDA